MATAGWECKESWEHGAPTHQFPEWYQGKVSMGTTLVACEFRDGVVIGADSRTSMGVYVSNRVSDKLTRITDHIYVCRSGSAADTQAVADVVETRLRLYSISTGKPITVELAASQFQDICYKYRDQLTAGIILAGWDEVKGGQVYSIPLGGMRVRQPVALGGSGSSYLYGFSDTNYKADMDQEQAETFVTTAVTLAIHRDGSSGGVVRYGTITKDGISRHTILHNELQQFELN